MIHKFAFEGIRKTFGASSSKFRLQSQRLSPTPGRSGLVDRPSLVPGGNKAFSFLRPLAPWALILGTWGLFGPLSSAGEAWASGEDAELAKARQTLREYERLKALREAEPATEPSESGQMPEEDDERPQEAEPQEEDSALQERPVRSRYQPLKQGGSENYLSQRERRPSSALGNRDRRFQQRGRTGPSLGE